MSNQFFIASVVAAGLFLTGCGEPPKPATPATDAHDHDHDHDHAHGHGHDHSHWWCSEHGVPEEQCALCSPKIAAEFKAKKDWCKEHDRPDSQCFICHPEYKLVFIDLYKAKYGKEPPASGADEHQDEHKHEEEHKEKK